MCWEQLWMWAFFYKLPPGQIIYPGNIVGTVARAPDGTRCWPGAKSTSWFVFAHFQLVGLRWTDDNYNLNHDSQMYMKRRWFYFRFHNEQGDLRILFRLIQLPTSHACQLRNCNCSRRPCEGLSVGFLDTRVQQLSIWWTYHDLWW